VGVVGDGRNALGLVLLGADGAGLAGLVSLALEEDGGALLLGLALLLGVGLDADDELLTRAGEADVLDTEVDALLDVAVADLLVDDDTNSGLGHVVDDTSLAVVVLVTGYVLVIVEIALSLAAFVSGPDGEDLRHALLDGTVADDIDDVTDLVLTKVGGQSDHALLLEIAGEGCVAESAFGVLIPHARRIILSAHDSSNVSTSIASCPSSSCPVARCETNHSECPS
jgi:hypothetical protein